MRLLEVLGGLVVLVALVGVGYGLVVGELSRGPGRAGVFAMIMIAAVAILIGSWAQTTGSATLEPVRIRERRTRN